MPDLKRALLSWHLVALLGCGSSQPAASTSSSVSSSVSAGAGGTSTGTGASGGGGTSTGTASTGTGTGGKAGAIGMPGSDSGLGTTMCVDRSSPPCQPKVIGPPGAAGTGLTVVGKNAYWRQVGKPKVLLRTSLDDDATAELVIPSDWAIWFEDTPYLFNDGTNVFAITLNCCAGVRNGLFGYYVSDGTWKFTDLLIEQLVWGFLHAAGSLFITFDGRFLFSYGPADLKRTKTVYMPPNQRAVAVGTDGTTIYMEVSSNGAYEIASFDGVAPMPFAKAPAVPYGASRLAVDETHVYFGAMSKLMSADRKTPGDPKEIVDVSPLHVRDLLVDERAAYWLDEGGLHAITKVDGKREDLASFGEDFALRPVVRQLDQNADYLVWAGRDGLSKLRK